MVSVPLVSLPSESVSLLCSRPACQPTLVRVLLPFSSMFVLPLPVTLTAASPVLLVLILTLSSVTFTVWPSPASIVTVFEDAVEEPLLLITVSVSFSFVVLPCVTLLPFSPAEIEISPLSMYHVSAKAGSVIPTTRAAVRVRAAARFAVERRAVLTAETGLCPRTRIASLR